MKRCLHCHRDSHDSAAHCHFCGKDGFAKLNPDAALPRATGNGVGFVVVAVFVLLGLLLLNNFWQQHRRLTRLEQQLAGELAGSQSEHEATVQQQEEALRAQAAAEEAKYRTLLENPKFLSGALAQEQRQKEWMQRVAHDPRFALTAIETNFLQMERLGHDPNVATQVALERIAALAAPPKSRIEVSSQGDGFAVRVAFRMSAMTANESGAVTKHHTTDSMRREIEELSARVMKELFDYCGSRGVEKLSISCNHALRRTLIPANATERERRELLQRAPVEMGCLYRVSLDRKGARAVTNWRQVSVPRVIPMMMVESDGLRDLEISGTASRFSTDRDPEGRLEF